MSTLDGLINDMIVSRYMLGAGFTLMLYDWLLTFAAERQYIWNAKWTPVKVVFLVNRYFMPLTLAFAIYVWGGTATILSPTFCNAYVTTDSFIILAFFATLHWLVAMRAWALWGRSRLMGAVIWGLFIVYLGSSGYLTGSAMAALDLFPVPIVNVCFGSIPTFLWSIWLPPIAFETIVFFLTGAKAMQHYRQKLDTPILGILYRDGFMYFVFICINSFSNLLVWALAPTSLVIVVKFFSTAICEVAGSHLILDLIEVGVVTGAARSVSHPIPNPGLKSSFAAVGDNNGRSKVDAYEMMPSPSSPHDREQYHTAQEINSYHSQLWTAPAEWDYYHTHSLPRSEVTEASYKSDSSLIVSSQALSRPPFSIASTPQRSRDYSSRRMAASRSQSQPQSQTHSHNSQPPSRGERSIQWSDRRPTPAVTRVSPAYAI